MKMVVSNNSNPVDVLRVSRKKLISNFLSKQTQVIERRSKVYKLSTKKGACYVPKPQC